MKKYLLVGVGMTLLMTNAAQAGIIERACLASGRKAASPSLCGCVQQAADVTLSRADQRKAAKFFKDPQRAQDVRQASDGNRLDFWDRYRAFGDTASAFCTG